MLSTTDSQFREAKNQRSGALWQSSQDTGHSDTTVVMTEIRPPGALSVTAGKGISADLRSNGDLSQSIKTLAAQPGTAWVGQSAQRNDVAWNAIAEAHQHWNYKSQGLTGAGAAVIAVAVAIATQGAGAGLLGALSQEAAQNAVLSAAADAGFSSLVSQASVSLINNGGDLGKTLQQLGSMNTVKQTLLSMAEAGAFSEIGTLTNGHLQKPEQARAYVVDQTPQYLANIAGHAAVGCAAGAAVGPWQPILLGRLPKAPGQPEDRRLHER